MESAFWEQVVAQGHRLPPEPPLGELTAELTTMLGATDPAVRDQVAYPTLAAWIAGGVYDDLLEGLGDGMALGLDVGLGEQDTDSVFRRSFSVLVLAACIRRDTDAHLVPPDTLLRWGDRVASWLVRERDLRGFVPGKGWAHAVAHGADALAALAGSEVLGHLELTVLLDLVADRLLLPTDQHLVHGEPDRLALATMRVLRRDLLGLEVLEPWVARLAADGADPDYPAGIHATDTVGARTLGGDPYAVPGNVQAFLRALHLQLALAAHPPSCRADLLLVLIEHLRRLNGAYLA